MNKKYFVLGSKPVDRKTLIKMYEDRWYTKPSEFWINLMEIKSQSTIRDKP